ncbi:MAG: hypothetical protein V1750_07870, partial [Acidobacteriota bacterium]
MRVALLSVLALVVAGISAAGKPSISFEQSRVVADGITPGAQAAWFSIARERPGWTTRVVRRES